MNKEGFVKALKLVACDNVSRGVVDVLTHPPGRRPKENLKELSNWFNALEPNDRDAVRSVVKLASDQAVYNVLLVLDGLLQIDSNAAKGDLQLVYSNGGIQILLNDPAGAYLSAEFKSQMGNDS